MKTPYQRFKKTGHLRVTNVRLTLTGGNRTAMSHEICLKMLNATFYSEYLDHQYNFKTGRVDVYCDGISMHNLYYKIEF